MNIFSYLMTQKVRKSFWYVEKCNLRFFRVFEWVFFYFVNVFCFVIIFLFEYVIIANTSKDECKVGWSLLLVVYLFE